MEFASRNIIYKLCITSKSLSNENINIEICNYNSKLCREFVVKSPPFNIKRWIIWTLLFNIIGFRMQLHLQEEWILTSSIIVLSIILWIRIDNKVKRESILIISGIGCLLTSTFASGRSSASFYEDTFIRGIVINEAITMHQVINYLTLLIGEFKDSSSITKLVPLFTHSWPDLEALITIYNEASTLLQNSKLI